MFVSQEKVLSVVQGENDLPSPFSRVYPTFTANSLCLCVCVRVVLYLPYLLKLNSAVGYGHWGVIVSRQQDTAVNFVARFGDFSIPLMTSFVKTKWFIFRTIRKNIKKYSVTALCSLC